MANMLPLPILVELLVNGVWIDISKFLLQRDGITITGGSSARADMNAPQPAQASFTLKNKDGRFTPQNTSGPYFPYLGQNQQVRISMNAAQSSSGNTYTGYRFWGEIPEWPSQSDISQHDVYVLIVATGPLRRINQSGGEGSSLTRYYATLTGAFAPIAYWPCEEDPDTDQVGTGTQGGTAMAITTTAQPKWKAVSDFNGSAPIGVLNRSTWDGLTGFFGTSGDDVFLDPGQTPWVASTTSTDVRLWGAGGGGAKGSEGNSGGTGGGGGGTARNATLATTPGATYYVNVGAGSPPCDWQGLTGVNGQDTTFTDVNGTVLLRAHGGGPGSNTTFAGAGGVAGTGGFAGGSGGFNASGLNSGAGGGGAGGITGAGGLGGSPGVGVGGAAGTAGTGGGSGNGGVGGSNPPETDGGGGKSRGGGGAGGWANQSDHTNGGAGSNGAAELVYTGTGGGTAPNANILRFVCLVPKHGGNPGKVLVRMLTAGTIARVDVQYAAGGKLTMIGYSGSGTQQFTTGAQAWGVDGQTVMVSAEMSTSGANVNYAFSAIIPGASGVIGKTSGTATTQTLGNVTEVLAGPNADITKTAIGHISVQYALVPLYQVSQALNGHYGEVGIDRFIRLANEQAMDNITEFLEAADHWGYESGTQSWTATNGAVTQSNFTVYPDIWPPEGSNSLLLTANGAGQPAATGPTGTSGQPILPGDIASVAVDMLAGNNQLNNAYVGVKWYNAAGGSVAGQINGADTVIGAGLTGTLTVRAKAPATTAYMAVVWGDHETAANGTLIYGDNVRIHPHMGVQTKKAYRAFLEEIRDLDAGLLKEAKELWGFKYRTRIRLINQTPAVTLDFSQGTISPPFVPSLDVQNLANDIIIKRYRGSKVRVTLTSGTMSILEPPGGKGRHLKTKQIIAAEDEQLLALASHLLLIGTTPNERYPTITVDLTRASMPGAALAPLMSAVAGVECGDYVQVSNLPVWYPVTPAKQLVIGYTETIFPRQWVITWNCVSESPYEITAVNLRRW